MPGTVETTEPKKKRSGWLSALYLVGAIVLAANFRDCSGTPKQKAKRAEEEKILRQESSDSTQCGDLVIAQVKAETFIRQRLKSPSTAQFNKAKGIRNIETCIHEIVWQVDAQNSFGATLRNNYFVKMKYNKEQDQWKLIKLALLGR